MWATLSICCKCCWLSATSTTSSAYSSARMRSPGTCLRRRGLAVVTSTQAVTARRPHVCACFEYTSTRLTSEATSLRLRCPAAALAETTGGSRRSPAPRKNHVYRTQEEGRGARMHLRENARCGVRRQRRHNEDVLALHPVRGRRHLLEPAPENRRAISNRPRVSRLDRDRTW